LADAAAIWEIWDQPREVGMAGKCHIWLWPFESTKEELAQIWNDLKHLYDHKNRTVWVVNADIRSNLPSSLAASLSDKDDVTIYVMGHTNIDFPNLHESTAPGSKFINPVSLAALLKIIVRQIPNAARFKVKFVNCRSAHAKYPPGVCAALYRMCSRDFTGFAYGLDVVTKARDEEGKLYPQKKANIRTGAHDVAVLRAKDMRFQVWPTVELKQADGTTLEDLRNALLEADEKWG
jgi:hypothetical protein